MCPDFETTFRIFRRVIIHALSLTKARLECCKFSKARIFFVLSTDVAISAPYGGKDQGGVVFIYFGTKDGIETSYRQVRSERAGAFLWGDLDQDQ